MKKSIAILITALLIFSFIGCADVKTIDGVTYDTYGLLNMSGNKNPDIQYRIAVGNIVWSCIFVETIIAPIYFIGFSIYEPVGVKDKSSPKGSM